jgi:hypothetical protein
MTLTTFIVSIAMVLGAGQRGHIVADREILYSHQVAGEGVLELHIQKVHRPPHDAAMQKTMKSGWGGGWGGPIIGSDFVWRVTATWTSELGECEPIWLAHVWPDPFEGGPLRVLAVSYQNRVLAVVWRTGGIIQAEIASPDVANYTLLSSSRPHVADKDHPESTSPMGRFLTTVHRMDPVDVKATFEGSLQNRDLAVRLTQRNGVDRKFVLVPDGEAWRWTSTATTQPSTQPAR